MAEPQSTELAREARSSIELSRDAKGVYRWDIKVYFDADHAETAAILEHIDMIDDELRMRYINPPKEAV